MTCILSDAMVLSMGQSDSVQCRGAQVSSWKRNHGELRLSCNPGRRDGYTDSQSWRNPRETSTLIGTDLMLFITGQFLRLVSVFIPVLPVKAGCGLGVDKRSGCG